MQSSPSRPLIASSPPSPDIRSPAGEPFSVSPNAVPTIGLEQAPSPVAAAACRPPPARVARASVATKIEDRMAPDDRAAGGRTRRIGMSTRLAGVSLYGRFFAATYDRMMAGTEEAGLARMRAELIPRAEGRVIEIGAG